MYAIISAGGKQHRVIEGERLRIDLINGKTKGDNITFDRVLMVGNEGEYKIGAPLVDGASVSATVVANGEDGTGEKAKKILVFKKIRTKGYTKLRGHRARYTEVKIEKISG